MKKIFLCSICNINSGTCNEDCKFCSQSVKYKADIERYKQKPVDKILDEARRLEALGALGFCLVTAQKGLDDKTLEFVCDVARAVKKEVPRLRLIACNGTASVEQLRELRQAGVAAYNHNLETSREFYSQICTTHPWEERYETCENVNSVGLKLISGGIFGMGETHEDRISMLRSLKELNPVSVPLNFYHHNPALPLDPSPLSVDEALSLITLARQTLDGADRIMIAGGREITFKERQNEIFDAGANSIVIGDYLTTAGRDAHQDLQMLRGLGFEIATSPEDK
ncbi:biotin synthase [Sulfuricurvum sp. IAE1]|jgi:biotin synthase|uniref:biotin synthase n=1 Tax=Sulfuricurvum sp. IAE1 TaxID=2546102 RepID=UPI001042E104|nr:biotin synthase [Sulfuricurvum sp. IAE1]MDD3770140.1 biotin synthase [Sulfuricurvum sp.]MDX9966818.1 biotin synthase [Sulfuricurvum sp.]TDA68235.1 biotin synthase [Sulfuricurvum sp. IAE1]